MHAVSTGGPGGKGPELPGLPSGWTWSRVFLAALGIGVGIAAWKYLNRRYFFKVGEELCRGVAAWGLEAHLQPILHV